MNFLEMAESGLSCSEIAARLGISRQAVYAKAKRAGVRIQKPRRSAAVGLVPRPTRPRGSTVMSAQSAGAWAELLACAHLLTHGFEVFRSVSPNCSVDLIARRGDDHYGVEVRCGMKQQNGSISYSPPRRKFDVLALVLLDGSVVLRGPRAAELKIDIDKQPLVV